MTADATPTPPPRRTLSVLNPNDKIEQLRREFEASGPAAPDRKFSERTPIDRALDGSKTPDQRRVEERVVDALKTVYDPEIPVNIHDLGLIYGIDVAADAAVTIRMTLTAPGCPVAGTIVADVERKVEDIDEVKSAKVELVWDPPWDKGRMSEAALLELGLL